MKNLLLITFLLFFSFSYAQEITMFDEAFSYRFYQDQERISIKEANQLMLSDSLSALHWKRARTKNTIVNGLLICQLAFIVAGSSGKISGEQYRVLGPIFFASSFTSLGLAFSRQKSVRKAILRYNSLFDIPKEEEVGVILQLKPTLMATY